jgi:hypothetical protein
VDIPTGSLPDGTVVRITPVQASELITAPPANFSFVGGINLALGGAPPAKYIDVGVPAPADARPDDQVLVVRYVEYPAFSGWTIVDRAFLEDGRYVTASPPFKGVLAQGAKLVKPGGRLVYATCSLLPEENEQIVEAFLAAHGDFQRLVAAEVLARQGIGLDTGEDLRLLPHSHGTDGFYAAVLERRRA